MPNRRMSQTPTAEERSCSFRDSVFEKNAGSGIMKTRMSSGIQSRRKTAQPVSAAIRP